ncbi:MAG: D-aminoacyl-tRNA deacylase [Petroclostridium sp.]|uniref:D-aminoacyl-tRNA deacylase n=1 Tax=Petroclostridium xylanilyticum TaxID=1792311 RepID=UPI000B983524|nr:D-aminoacyl-tRNA deacylase [Petroclostridium xylanilyticum]MBZ4644842.1 D-tyrosyl-tRNA(Tyr) deacylase [Clostridia bacterium]MDK2809577.1 D-aminoacyl-tRNA deacylase [Petroclostridium sp.]
MRAVVQRVASSKVTVEGNVTGEINKGLMVLLGVGPNDTSKDLDYMVEKILNLRIFEDSEGKMNLSLLDVEGELLVVSQFTLYGDCRKGRRPSFAGAAPPELANKLYEQFISKCREAGVKKVQTGVFGAHMLVNICNDGPVTLLIDSEKQF